MTALLEVEDLRVAYGKIEAVKGISFSVEAGQVVTLIGTNGAGKTTTLRTLSGLLKPTSGKILFNGQPLDGVPAHKIVALGLAHSPEGRHIFPASPSRKTSNSGHTSATTRPASRRTSSAPTTSSPSWANAASRPQERCPAVSSKCWQWGAPSCPSPSSSCSTNPPWASPRS